MTGADVLQRFTKWTATGAETAAKVRAIVERWGTPLWTLLTMSLMDGILVPKKSVAVSIERGFVWVAKGSRFLSKIKITGFRKYAFEEGKYVGPESLASTLSLALKDLKASRTGLVLAIPKDWVIIRTAELPATVKANIVDVIAYELDRLTPLTPDASYYDFRILSEREGKLNLLLVAARANVVNEYLNALKEENITVARVTVNLLTLGTLCEYLDPGTDSICLEVDRFGYEGGVIHNHEIVHAFGDTFSSDDRAKREDVIVEGVEPVVHLVRSLGLAPLVLVHMKERGVCTLEEKVSAPLRMFGSSDVKLGLAAGSDDISYAAIGAALDTVWPKAHGFDILGKGQKTKVAIPRAVTFALILLFLATFIPYAVLPVQREQKRLAEIERQISIRKEEVKKVEALKKEVDVVGAEAASIDNFKESKPKSLVLMKELTTNLPKSVWLTRVRISETGADVEGYANSASEILPKLEQSKYFKKVEFASPTIRDTRMNADRFVIKMDLEGFAAEEGEKTPDGKKK